MLLPETLGPFFAFLREKNSGSPAYTFKAKYHYFFWLCSSQAVFPKGPSKLAIFIREGKSKLSYKQHEKEFTREST